VPGAAEAHRSGSGLWGPDLRSGERILPLCSGKQFERVAVARPDDGEVSAVERDHHARVEALGQRDDGGVRASERQVGVLIDEVGDPFPV
jgi:hypothetical protein